MDNEIQKFDFIVIDEVQDLSVVQIYLLYNLLKDKKAIFFTGDYHQIINPTYFNFGNLINLFYANDVSVKKSILTKNYRSQKYIVELCKGLVAIRKKYIGNIEEEDEFPIRRGGAKPFILKPSDENLAGLLEALSKRESYTAIVVPDEDEKKKLKDINKNCSMIFTVQEIKGLEYQYIVCYNMISKFIDRWKDIFDGKGKRNSKYRYYFNILYVAMTRAKDNLCVYEEEVDNPVFNHLKDHFNIVENFREDDLLLLKISDINDILKNARHLEDKEKYEQALGQYKKIQNLEGVARCRAKILANKGHIEEAGDILYENKLYENAVEYYKKSKNKIKLARAMIGANALYDEIISTTQLNSEEILKDIILNNSNNSELENAIMNFVSQAVNSYLKKCESLKTYMDIAEDLIKGGLKYGRKNA